jgi:type IV pilus assembly protein PilM
MAEHLRSVVKQTQASCKNVALILRHEDAVLLRADLPQASTDDLRKMIRMSPKNYLGQDLPDHIFDCFYRVTEKTGDTSVARRRQKSRVLVAGARRGAVENAEDLVRLAGFNLVALVPGPVALVNAFRLVRDDSHPDAVALLDMGATHSTINIVGQGDVLLSRVVALGAEKFSDVLSSGTGGGGMAEEGSPEAMQARLQKAILAFAREVDASVGFYTSQHERHISQLFVSGGTARSQFVLQMLESELTYSCEPWNLLQHIGTELSAERLKGFEYDLPQMILAIGCGAGVMDADSVSLNLLAEGQAELEAKRRDPVRRATQAAILLVALVVAYAGWLGWCWLELKGEVAEVSAQAVQLANELNSPEQQQSQSDGQQVRFLHAHATNRVLYAPILNALQFVDVPGIRVQNLSIDRVRRTERVETKDKASSETFERVILNLTVRNYGDYPNYTDWEAAIRAQPYFAEHLDPERDGGVVLGERSGPMPDLQNPEEGQYMLHSVGLWFRERML